MQRKYTVICLSSMCTGVLCAWCVQAMLSPTPAIAQGIAPEPPAIAPIRNASRRELPRIVNRSQISQPVIVPSEPAETDIDPTSGQLQISIPADTPHAGLQEALRQFDRTAALPTSPLSVPEEPQTTTTGVSTRTMTPIGEEDWSLYTPEERVNISVYEKANRSVVNISTRTVRPDFFMRADIAAEGTGSGSVLDKDGHILTNLHVVEGAREIRVTLHNGQDYDAGIVGQDPVNDVAVLRIAAPAEDLYPVMIGESDNLRVGQKVYAIGNPFGLDRSMTIGIVSSLNRTIPSRNGRSMKSIVQIDAALNQGSSGGPLLNSRGDLIGMNTAIATDTGQYSGIGFAIPAGTIRRVVPQLIESGRVTRGSAGIAHVHPTEAGLLVAALAPGGPAEQAGIQGFRVIREQKQRGAYLYERTVVDRSGADLILAVDEKPVQTFDQMLTAVEEKQPGEDVVFDIVRNGERRQVRVQLQADQ